MLLPFVFLRDFSSDFSRFVCLSSMFGAAVYCEGREEPLPAASRGVQGHQADRSDRMGLSGSIKMPTLSFEYIVFLSYAARKCGSSVADGWCRSLVDVASSY